MIIDKRGIEEFFNVKTPYRSIKKTTFPFYFLIVMFLANYLLNISFVLFQNFPKHGILAFCYLVMGFIAIALFLASTAKKPGYICVEAEQNDF